MPAAVIGICLMPLGLDGVPLWVMGQGLAWVLFVADTVAAWHSSLHSFQIID